MKRYYDFQIERIDELFKEFQECAFTECNMKLYHLFQELHKVNIFHTIMYELEMKYPITKDELNSWCDNRNSPNNVYRTWDKNKYISLLLHWCDDLCKNTTSYTKTSLVYVATPGITDETNKQKEQNDFKRNIVLPIITYIKGCLVNVQFSYYLLNRYKMRVENFYRKDLKEKYKEAKGHAFEATLQNDLRLFLFDQGIEYPFSSIGLPSGNPDVFSQNSEDDILVSEVKILDKSKNYGLNRLKKGFSQLTKYVNEMQVQVGYLVVFNMNNTEVSIKGKKQDNVIICNNKIYHFIIVNMYDDESASKAKAVEKEEYLEEEIIADMDSL